MPELLDRLKTAVAGRYAGAANRHPQPIGVSTQQWRGQGLAAEVSRVNVALVRHHRKSWWPLWLLGGLVLGVGVACGIVAPDSNVCSDFGDTSQDGKAALAFYSILGGSIVGSVLMGKDETVYRSGSGLNLGVVPSGRGFVVGGSFRF